MKKSHGVVLGFFVVALAAYTFASPYLALKDLRAAAQAGNAEGISDHVDFPAVRESLKNSVNAMVAKDIERKGDGKYAKLGAAFASAFTGPLVEAYVTPQNIARMVQGQKVDPMFGKGQEAPPADAAGKPAFRERYETMGRFVVESVGRDKDGKETVTGFVFSRQGLFGWKLTSLRLPNL